MYVLDSTIMTILASVCAFAIGWSFARDRERDKHEARLARTDLRWKDQVYRLKTELEKTLGLYRAIKLRNGRLVHLLREERRGSPLRDRSARITLSVTPGPGLDKLFNGSIPLGAEKPPKGEKCWKCGAVATLRWGDSSVCGECNVIGVTDSGARVKVVPVGKCYECSSPATRTIIGRDYCDIHSGAA